MKQFAKTPAITMVLALALGPIKYSHAADLWDIYELALANDPEYQVAQLNHQSTRLDLSLAETAFKPSVTATGQIGQQISDASGSSRTGDDHLLDLSVNLPLYDKTRRVGITQSAIQVEISALQLQDAKQALMLRVADRYFNLLAARDAREVARLEKVAIRRQMDLASERLEVGLGTRTDLFDTRARFKLAEATAIQAQNQINNEAALLRQIIGMTPQALAPLDDSAPLELPSPNNVDAWVNRSLETNIPLQIQALNLQKALQEIDKQNNGRTPTVSLNGSHSFNSRTAFSSPAASSEINTTSIELRVSVPVYRGGAVNLRTRQAGAQYNRIERLLEQTKRLASTRTTSAFLAVTSSASQVEALFEAITAGENALEAKEEGFSAGLTTNLDVLNAQRDLSRSRTDYLRARYNYIISVLELERSVGQLDEEDIKRVNHWLGATAQ